MNARQQVNFGGTDYLGLARDTRLVEALVAAAREHGVSASSSRWASGWSKLHERLEQELAAFFGAEDVCIVGSAYLCGPVYFWALAPAHPVAYCDANCHSNLFLGMTAAGMEVRTYRHLDAADLRRLLERHQGPPPVLIADGVYGISGELSPLEALARLAADLGAELLVDDAHGVFALGDSGRGSAELCGLAPAQATVLGSMSKALGSYGGFLAGRRELVERFRRGPASSGSTVAPPAIVAACLEALRIVRTEPELRQRMHRAARRIRSALAARGLAVAADRSPIVAPLLKDDAEAAALSRHLLSHGICAPYFQYASEPRRNLLRLAARACHSEDDLARFERAIGSF